MLQKSLITTHILQKRRGKKKAIIAIARRILTAIYHILRKCQPYNPSAFRLVRFWFVSNL